MLQTWGWDVKALILTRARNRSKLLLHMELLSAKLEAQPFLTISASPALAPSIPSVKVMFAVQRNKHKGGKICFEI